MKQKINSIFLVRKEKLLLFTVFCSQLIIAQIPSTPSPLSSGTIATQLPNITPASPSVAALMKFEEVPVSNYTGIPDISVPLYKVETLSKDITIDVSLKYHPGSIAIDETASYTGLGWNLIAGGSISRMVKDSPDEIFTSVGNKIGILQDNIFDSSGGDKINRYYQVLSLQGPGVTNDITNNILGPYGWNVAQRDIMDTQHDIFQYNFMGHTGRFFIKRNQQTGILEVIKLDNDNALKIELNYNDDEPYDYINHGYNINFYGFTIYDDLGYKYIFNVKETTNEINSVASKSFGFAVQGEPGMGYVANYTSAFHLDEIKDNNENVLAKFTYETSSENTQKKSFTWNRAIYPDKFQSKIDRHADRMSGLLPEEIASTQTLNIVTQKIKNIYVTNKANISFTTVRGRQDSDINQDAPKLESIIVNNLYGDTIKRFRFDYTYLNIMEIGAINAKNKSRLALESVADINIKNNSELHYGFEYKNPSANSQGIIKKDYWGYFTNRTATKEPDEEMCSTHVLQRMTLPTGGSIEFNYGSNTYSYIGGQEVTDFTIDNDAPLILQPDIPTDPGIPAIYPMDPTSPIDVFFIPSSPLEGGTFTIHSDIDPTPISIDGFMSGSGNNGAGLSIPFTLQPGRNYFISYTPPTGSSPTSVQPTLKVFRRGGNIVIPSNKPDPKWLLGGGVRINDIKYYDGITTDKAAKIKYYDYRTFADTLKSSGSLVFLKPLYQYEQGRDVYYPGINTDDGGLGESGGTANSSVDPRFPVGYMTTTDRNSLSYIRTKGADVGYKNVTVWEDANGKSEYTYTSPIDFPENGAEIMPPFRPTSNIDFLRGLLLKEKHYSQFKVTDSTYAFKPLAERQYIYSDLWAEIRTINTGTIMTDSGNPKVGSYGSFSAFKTCMSTSSCRSNWGYMGEEGVFLSVANEIVQAFGWPKLMNKISKEYFYPDNGTQAKILSTSETYEYDEINKRIKESASSTSNVGEVLVTKYFYDTNIFRNRLGAIKRIETYRGTTPIDTKEILYTNNWQSNISYLPKEVSSSKGINSLERRLQFIKYDSYGNLLEARQENGNSLCYVWGYNYTQPIAIIENMDYATLSANPSLQNYMTLAINNSNVNNSALVLSNLELLQAALPASASMTGYVYKPLVGIITALDQRGYKLNYKYDGYQRLEEVRDEKGHLMSKNSYNYKSNN